MGIGSKRFWAALSVLALAGPAAAAPKAGKRKRIPLPPPQIAPSLRQSSAPISVVYPPEGLNLGEADGQLILGSVSDPRGVLTLNGSTVTVYRTGAFLAWEPVTGGTFTFHLNLKVPNQSTSFYLDRLVYVTSPLSPFPATPERIDPDSLWPQTDEELRPGDWLVVRMKGSPGGKASFRAPGGSSWQPMRELDPALGIYEGALLVQPGDNGGPAPVKFQLGTAAMESRASVSLRSLTPAIAVVRNSDAVINLKTGPGEGELFPVPPGARVVTAGFVGSETKIALSGGIAGWIETKHLDFLPPGSAPPRAVTDVIGLSSEPNAAVVRIQLTERVPYSLEESEDLSTLTVYLHYATDHTNWIVFNSEDPMIDSVRVEQRSEGLVAVTIRLKPRRAVWGYEASYEGSTLKVSVRRPPRIKTQLLSGLKIFLDPGHMPSAPGTVGGLGTLEMDMNFAIAKALERLLKKEGARVILSRRSDADEVGLAERTRMAKESQADVFISIHNNNLPGGVNPFKAKHGYSIFYFHPHSFDLAREVYRAYGRNLPLYGEGLRYGNLLVARMSAMPAILTESAYLTFPEQEALLLKPSFRQKLAGSILEGLKAFLAKERQRQRAETPAASVSRPAK